MAFALSDIDAPTEGEQWLLRAEELFTAEEFVPALSAANQAVLATSGSARVTALGVVAACCVQLGQAETAETVAQQRHDLLLELDRPLEADSQARMGLALFGRSEPFDLAALERESKASAALPPRLHAITLLAHAEVMWRQSFRDLENIHASAGLAYLQADLAEDPGSIQFRALRFLVQIAYDAGDAARMLEFGDRLRASARNRTEQAEAHTFHALALSGLDKPVEALRSVNRAVDLYQAIDVTERLYSTTILSGRIAVDARERPIALGRFRDAVTIADQMGIDNSEARKAVANTLVATENHTEAIGMLTEVYNHETSTGASPEIRAESLEFMAHSLAATDQLDAAIQVWTMAANLYTEARALHILGDPQDAVEQATKAANALRTAKDSSGALTIERFAAQVLAEQGRHKEAIKLLKTVVKNARGDAEMLAGATSELADCYDAVGKKRRATGTRSLAENTQP